MEKIITKFEQLYNIVEESVFEKILRDIYDDGSERHKNQDLKHIIDELEDLDYIEVLMNLEKHYDITITDAVDDMFTNDNIYGFFKSINRENILNKLGISETCPECKAPIKEKYSGVSCSKCDWFDCL